MAEAYAQFEEKRRRGQLLQILASSGDQGCNVPLLRSMLRGAGYRAAEETVAIDLSFLAQHGFATLREIGTVQLARITARGRDVVTGDLTVPGIERPEFEV